MSAGNSITIGIIVIIFVILIILSFRLSLFLARRAICKVITILRDNLAVNDKNAHTLEDLTLDFRFQFRIFRDYRPWAFHTLVQAGIIRSPVPGKYYLSEATLRTNQGIQCEIK